MKRVKIISGVICMLLSSAPFVHAADGREAGSGLAMWGFLGLCAAIIALQLLPAVKKLLGFAGEKAHETAAAKEKADH
jgi:hypothetical protein